MLDEVTKDYISKFEKLALAVSGGRDSMALLNWFSNNVDKCRFFVVTVHHNLRGDEGRRDRDFVREYCVQNGIDCQIFEEDIPAFCAAHGYTVEQGARIRRREIFKDITAKGNAQRVVTAHHLSDQVESVLMHIFRGSGIAGLKGMSIDDGVLLRPMLDVSREQIDAYVLSQSVPYVDDSSNDCVDYTRNKLRKEIIPLIKQVYSGLENNVAGLAKRAAETYGFIDRFCRDYRVENDGVYIPVAVLTGERAIAAQSVVNAVESITTRVDLTAKHIDSIISLATKANGASVSLPFSLKAHRDCDCVVLALDSAAQYSAIIDGYGEYDLGEKILIISQKQTGKLRCDLDKLIGCVIRNRKTGDTFKRYKGGSKSLGDYLTDIKAPKRKRDALIVAAKESKVLLLPDYEISDWVKVDENTEQIAYISVKDKAD